MAYAIVIGIVLSGGVGLSWGAYGILAFYLLIATILYAFFVQKRPKGLKILTNITRWLVVLRAGAWVGAVVSLGEKIEGMGINVLLAAISIGLTYWLLLRWRLILGGGELVYPKKHINILLVLFGLEVIKYMIVV